MRAACKKKRNREPRVLHIYHTVAQRRLSIACVSHIHPIIYQNIDLGRSMTSFLKNAPALKQSTLLAQKCPVNCIGDILIENHFRPPWVFVSLRHEQQMSLCSSHVHN